MPDAYDLPCHGRRLVSESEGIKATFVAGTQLYEDGKLTGAMPGRILRGYDSRRPPPAGDRVPGSRDPAAGCRPSTSM
jgi:hypothetical protein